MKCPSIIKEAWMPPKRVWGNISEKAWNTLKTKKFIKPDRQILEGVTTGNVKITKEMLNKGWEVNKTRLRDVPKHLKKGDWQEVMGTLVGPSTQGEPRMISLPARNSIYGKLLHKMIGVTPNIAKRHELLEAKATSKLRNAYMLTEFNIRKKVSPLVKKMVPKNYRGLVQEQTVGAHYHPSVITSESNLIRGLSGKKIRKFKKFRAKTEGKVLEKVLGKGYGEKYFTNADAKKIHKALPDSGGFTI